MREYKKLWNRDKGFYLIAILIITLFVLIYSGKNLYQGYDSYKEIITMQVDSFNKMEADLDKYIEKGVFTEEEFYKKYTIEIDNERFIIAWDWNDWILVDVYNHIYRGVLIVLFVIQSLRFYMYDSRKNREFVDTLPIKKRSWILYEWFMGILLYTIPMFVSVLPFGIYGYKANKLLEENHCYAIKNLDFDSYSMWVILTGWVFVLFIYSLFILMRYLTNSLGANYVVGALFFSTPYALIYILESFRIYSLNYEKILGIEAVFYGLGNFIEDFSWIYSQVNVGQLIIEMLLAILFIIIAIIFTEKCKKEVNGMFAHKAVKVVFLMVIYIWTFIFVFNCAENVPLAIMTVISIIGSGVITAGVGYLIRAR